MSGLVIRKVVLHFKEVSLELEDVLLVITDLVVQRILLVGVSGLQFSDLVAVGLPQSADFLEKMGYFAVFEGDLRTEDF